MKASQMDYAEDCMADIHLRLGECALEGIGRECDLVEAAEHLSYAKACLYKKICRSKDPFGKLVLEKVEHLLYKATWQLTEEGKL